MKCYTIANCEIYTCIETVERRTIILGKTALGPKCVEFHIPENCVFTGNLLKEMPGPCHWCVVLVEDHSGFGGSWYIRAAYTDLEWEIKAAGGELPPARMEPFPRILASTIFHQIPSNRVGAGPEYLLLLEPGEKFELVRYGRLYGESLVHTAQNNNGCMEIHDPLCEAMTRILEKKYKEVFDEIVERTSAS